MGTPISRFFVSTKFHFDETISLAGLVSLSSLLFVRATFMKTLRLCNFCNFGATLLGFGILFTNIILLWIRNSEKNRTTPTPQKNKNPPKTLRIYMNLWKLCDYVTFVDLELEVWNLVQWSLISFCLGSEILVQF